MISPYLKILFVLVGTCLMISSALPLPVNMVCPSHQVQQGISGYIYKLQGNHMPKHGSKMASGKGMRFELIIYPAVKATAVKHTGALFNNPHIPVAATGRSDSSGYYRIGLPPGDYTVFIKIPGGLYAEETNSDGYVNNVHVSEGGWTNKLFYVRQNATY